jgi:hypothetical protein
MRLSLGAAIVGSDARALLDRDQCRGEVAA